MFIIIAALARLGGKQLEEASTITPAACDIITALKPIDGDAVWGGRRKLSFPPADAVTGSLFGHHWNSDSHVNRDTSEALQNANHSQQGADRPGYHHTQRFRRRQHHRHLEAQPRK